MKLIIKALYQKRIFQYGVLIFIFALTILTMQMSASITLKNETLIDQVNNIKGAHTNIYVQNRNQDGDFTLENYMDSFNEVNELKLIDFYEKSYYVLGSTWNLNDQKNRDKTIDELTSKSSKEPKVYIEGYISEKGSNQYEVLKGKPIKELVGNELAINERYANSFHLPYDELIGKTIYQYPYIMGGERDHELTAFKITSIYKDPTSSALAQQSDNEKTIFKTNATNYSAGDYYGIANYETVKKAAIIDYRFVGEIDEELGYWPDDFTFYTTVYKVHYLDYSIEDEAAFLTLYSYNRDHSSGSFTYKPFYTLLMQETPSQNIFKYLSYTLLAALLIADFFIFYAFFKRQLDEDKEKLALMHMGGVKRSYIIFAYICILWAGMAFSLGSIAVLDIIAILAGLQNVSIASLFFQINPLIIGCTLIGTLIFTSLLSLAATINIRKFLKHDLMHMLKEKDLTISKKHKRRISYRFQIVSMALRDLLSSRFKLIRVVFASAFLILCILMTYSSYRSVSNMFSRETISLHYDYTLERIDAKQLKTLKKSYVKDISVMYSDDKYFYEQVNKVDDIDIYLHYPAKLVHIYDDMKPYVDIHKGTYPTQAERFYPEIGWIYEEQEVLLSRTISDLKEAQMAGEDNETKDIAKNMLGYNEYPYTVYNDKAQNYVYVKGMSDSLFNSGYTAFTIFRRDTTKDYMILHNDAFNLNTTTIVNLKDNVTMDEFEAYLKQEGIKYQSYDTLMKMMNLANQDIQAKTFAVMSVVMSLMILLLVLLVIANTMEESIHKKKQYEFMKQSGYPNTAVQGVKKAKILWSLVFALVSALVLYVPIKWLYFEGLCSVIGVFHLVSRGYELLLFSIIGLLICLWMLYVMCRKKE